MSRGDAQWTRLQEQLRLTVPRCDGDNRFVCDELTPADLEDMERLCDACPLKNLCRAYAEATKPPGTFWAGKHYPAPKEAS